MHAVPSVHLNLNVEAHPHSHPIPIPIPPRPTKPKLVPLGALLLDATKLHEVINHNDQFQSTVSALLLTEAAKAPLSLC